MVKGENKRSAQRHVNDITRFAAYRVNMDGCPHLALPAALPQSRVPDIGPDWFLTGEDHRTSQVQHIVSRDPITCYDQPIIINLTLCKHPVHLF